MIKKVVKKPKRIKNPKLNDGIKKKSKIKKG